MSGLAAESGRWLLRSARHAIAAHLGVEAEAPGVPPAELQEARGIFVTLVSLPDLALRGCIGFVEPRGPLAKSVEEAALAAACRDPRFDPVTRGEYDDLGLEVSVLSRPEPIAPDDVVVGTHGLIVRKGGRSGLLLPQVPGEQGWNREEFLSFTCRKAGLPTEAWRSAGVELLGFSAQVFHEDPPEGRLRS